MCFTATFFSENRKHLGEKLLPESIALLHAGVPVYRSGDETYPFSVDRNFFYLTGIREANVFLVLKKNKYGHVSEILYIPKADPSKEKWVGKTISAEKAHEISGISSIRTADFWYQDAVLESFNYLYTDSWATKLNQMEIKGLLAPIRQLQSKDIFEALQQLRNIKSSEEVEAIQKAIAITAKGIEAVGEALKPGISEKDLQHIYEFTIACHGGEGNAFAPIVAAGANAAVLHYSANRDIVKEHALLLLDLGAIYHCYNGDISRTLCCGTPTDEQAAIYEAVRVSQQEIISLYQVGAKMKTIQEKTKEILKSAICSRKLVPFDYDINEVYFHNVGHPLGLDVHDLGRQPELVLEPGMVITCEPGLYFADKGIGVRIEDDILITDKGPENLSADIPKIKL